MFEGSSTSPMKALSEPTGHAVLGMQSNAKCYIKMYPTRSLHKNILIPAKKPTMKRNARTPDLSMGSGIEDGSGVSVPYINKIYRRPHSSLGFASTAGRPAESKEFNEIKERQEGAPDRAKMGFQFYDTSEDPKEQRMHQMFLQTVEGKLHNTLRRGMLS